MILLPLGVVFATVGGIMYFASAGSGPSDDPEIRHPVSEKMLADASMMTAKAAPYFRIKDAHGLDVQIGGAGKRPQLVYFILDGCPCSVNAQPLFNKLYLRYKDRVDFVGVINVSQSKAIDYAGQMTLLHPLVCDESLRITKAFGARQSTYNVVIRPDGMIDKLWPGYSQKTVLDLDRRLAKLTHSTDPPIDASLAPEEMASGCFFY